MKQKYLITENQLESLIKSIIDFLTKGGKGSLDFMNPFKSIFSSIESKVGDNFESMVDKIIDEFEGGYYDPKTMYSSEMGDSGETMYGMDAKASDMLSTSEGKEFWDLIHDDKKKNPNCWKYNYDPAKSSGKCSNLILAKKLKQLIAKMMKANYDEYASKYLSDESRKIVEKEPTLLFNFTYAVWNGPGYFQKFGRVMNDKVKSGIKDPKVLSGIMLDYRKNFSEYSSFANNLTRRGGKQMEKILNTL